MRSNAAIRLCFQRACIYAQSTPGQIRLQTLAGRPQSPDMVFSLRERRKLTDIYFLRIIHPDICPDTEFSAPLIRILRIYYHSALTTTKKEFENCGNSPLSISVS